MTPKEQKRMWLRRQYAQAQAWSVNVAIIFISRTIALAVFTRAESARTFTTLYPEHKARRVHIMKWRPQ